MCIFCVIGFDLYVINKVDIFFFFKIGWYMLLWGKNMGYGLNWGRVFSFRFERSGSVYKGFLGEKILELGLEV